MKSKNWRAECPLHWVTGEDACATLPGSGFFRLQVNPVNPVNPVKKLVRMVQVLLIGPQGPQRPMGEASSADLNNEQRNGQCYQHSGQR